MMEIMMKMMVFMRMIMQMMTMIMIMPMTLQSYGFMNLLVSRPYFSYILHKIFMCLNFTKNEIFCNTVDNNHSHVGEYMDYFLSSPTPMHISWSSTYIYNKFHYKKKVIGEGHVYDIPLRFITIVAYVDSP